MTAFPSRNERRAQRRAELAEEYRKEAEEQRAAAEAEWWDFKAKVLRAIRELENEGSI